MLTETERERERERAEQLSKSSFSLGHAIDLSSSSSESPSESESESLSLSISSASGMLVIFIFSKIYLYSAHINTQYLLNNGITIDNIISLLDNSTYKIDKKLYGYNLDINHPSSIENDNAPIVVVSHMGAYIDEIKKDLIKINKNVIFL